MINGLVFVDDDTSTLVIKSDDEVYLEDDYEEMQKVLNHFPIVEGKYLVYCDAFIEKTNENLVVKVQDSNSTIVMTIIEKHIVEVLMTYC